MIIVLKKLCHLQRQGWTQRLSYRMKSESEKQVSYINVLMWNLEKNGTDEPICKVEIETWTQRANIWTQMGKGDSMKWEIGTDIYIYISAVYVIDNHTMYKYYIV